MGDHARLASLVLVAVLVAACGGQGSTVKVLPVPDAPSDPCKVGVTHLGAFTQRLAGDLVTLRSLLVAPTFDYGATSKAIKVVSATLAAYPELEPSLQACRTAAELAQRVTALQGTAETTVAPSLATWISDGEVHWVAAYGLVRLLPEVLALSEAARVAGGPLQIVVATATDPAGANPPTIPPGPFAVKPPQYGEFAARIDRRGAEFVAFMKDEDVNLIFGGASEERRVGRRIATFSDTEISWLKSHPPLPCYAAFWRATLAVWTDVYTAGNWYVDGSRSSARSSLERARNHLTTLLDRDYISDAERQCVAAPGQAP